MTPRVTALVNYGAYQAGWFAAVLGAASGHGSAGVAVAGPLIALHLWLARERGRELGLLALATVVGLAVETWQLHAGARSGWIQIEWDLGLSVVDKPASDECRNKNAGAGTERCRCQSCDVIPDDVERGDC